GWRRFRAWIVPRSGGRSGGGCALRARGALFSRLLSPVVRRGRHGRPGRCGGGLAGLPVTRGVRQWSPRCSAGDARASISRRSGTDGPSPTPRGKGRIPMIRKRRAVVCTAALSAAVTAVTPATATAQADGQADGGRAGRGVDTRPHPGGDGPVGGAAAGRRNRRGVRGA